MLKWSIEDEELQAIGCDVYDVFRYVRSSMCVRIE